MNKIDITNALYHAIISNDMSGHDYEMRYKKMESILKSGYIYSCNKLLHYDIRFSIPVHKGVNPNDYICVACNPNSEVASNYIGISNIDANGYVISQLSFGFCFDKSLLTDSENMPGFLDYEIFVKDQISITKYALGMINAGGTISKDLYIYRDFLKYISGKLSKEEFQQNICNVLGYKLDNISWYTNDTKNVRGYFSDYVEKQITSGGSGLIVSPFMYQRIQNLLKHYGYNIPILDNSGDEIISLDHQKQKVLNFVADL